MEFTYTLSLHDVVTLNKVVYRRVAATINTARTRLALFALNVAAWMAIAYTSAAYVSLYKRSPRSTADLNELLIAFGVAVVLLAASYIYRQNLYRGVVFSESSWLRAVQSVSATSESLEITTPGACSRYDWSRFTDCVEDQTLLYLFLDRSSAVVIPKNAFSTPEELSQFRSWAEISNKFLQATREMRAPEQ